MHKLKSAIITLVGLGVLLLFCAGLALLRDYARNRDPKLFDAYVTALTMDYLYDRLADPPRAAEDFLQEEERGADYWNVISNSTWIQHWVQEIVPYFYYEGLGRGIYPRGVVVAPYEDAEAFHLLGRANCLSRVVTINLRYVNPASARYGRDDLLVTLVHELGHVQGLCGWDPNVEGNTQIVTLEVLAAMVNHGNRAAIKPLVGELRDVALNYISAYGGLTDAQYDSFIRYLVYTTPVERARFDKSMRYWADDRARLAEIVRKYGAYPYDRVWETLQREDLKTDPMPVVSGVVTLNKTIVLNDLQYFLQQWVWWLVLGWV